MIAVLREHSLHLEAFSFLAITLPIVHDTGHDPSFICFQGPVGGDAARSECQASPSPAARTV